MDKLTCNLQKLGYTVKIGNLKGCEYTTDVLNKLQIVIKLCKENEKLVFLFVGDYAKYVLQSYKKVDKSDFVLFFTDNYLHSMFDFYDTATKLKLALRKYDDDCFVCLSSVMEKQGRRSICTVCQSVCCIDCFDKLNDTINCPVCRTRRTYRLKNTLINH